MFFVGGNFASCLRCTVKPKQPKTFSSKPSFFQPCNSFEFCMLLPFFLCKPTHPYDHVYSISNFTSCSDRSHCQISLPEIKQLPFTQHAYNLPFNFNENHRPGQVGEYYTHAQLMPLLLNSILCLPH